MGVPSVPRCQQEPDLLGRLLPPLLGQVEGHHRHLHLRHHPVDFLVGPLVVRLLVPLAVDLPAAGLLPSGLFLSLGLLSGRFPSHCRSIDFLLAHFRCFVRLFL